MQEETAGAAAFVRFAIAQRGGPVHEVVIRTGEVAFLGRAPKASVVVQDSSVSSQHVEFSLGRVPANKSPERAGQPCVLARDRSQNGTGLCRLGPDGLPDLVNIWRLSSGPELLEDGQVFVIPLRSKSRQVGQNEVLETSLFHFYMDPGPGGNWPPRPLALIGQGNGRAEEAVLPARVPDKLADSDILPDCYDPSSGVGRWNYQARLGEGGLGIVYRAYDCRGNLGHVAIKVLKHPQRAYWGKQHCFAMHRESQWSLQKIHNRQDGRYCESSAKLFARYLEDHTGLLQVCPGSFDERRKRFETPGLDWEKDGPTVVAAPYVVMELVEGEAMHVAMDREWRAPSKHGVKDPPPMTVEEKRQVLIQAARALEYLATFGLIHRDFRGCNMHLAERAVDGAECVLKVLDLGVMITDEDWQQSNTNDAVQAFRRRGETEEKRRRYDWLPWEVRISADGIGPPLNFEKPVHSFDMFSLGVLALHLTIGRTEARSRLSAMESAGAGKDLTAVEVIDTSMLGLDPMLHRYMLGPAALRPAPSVVVRSIEAKLADPQKLPLTSKANVGRLPRGRGVNSGPLGPEVTLSRTRSPTIWPEERTRDPALMNQVPQPKRLLPPDPPTPPAVTILPPPDPPMLPAVPAPAPVAPMPEVNGHRQGDLPKRRDPPGASAKSVARIPRDWESRSSSEDGRLGRPERITSQVPVSEATSKRSQRGEVASRSRSRGLNGKGREERSIPRDAEEAFRSSWRSESLKDVPSMSPDQAGFNEPGTALFRSLRRCTNLSLMTSQIQLPSEKSCHWILRFPLDLEAGHDRHRG